MNNIWFTSDQHFGHDNVIKHCDRPFDSIEEMNESLIDNFNSVVKMGDTVWHIGDFAFPIRVKGKENQTKYVESIWRRLNGNHEFIEGNHDQWVKLFEKFNIQIPNLTMHGRAHSLKLKIDGEKHLIELNHYAHAIWNKSHYGSWHLHGHSHGSYNPPYGKIMDVGVDPQNYFPIHLDEVKKFMDGREFKPVDHHA